MSEEVLPPDKIEYEDSSTSVPGTSHTELLNSDVPIQLHVCCKTHHELQKKLDQTIEHVYYYRTKSKKEESRVDAIEKECRERISDVRDFWKIKIYNEGSRPGKILKAAMQNKTC